MGILQPGGSVARYAAWATWALITELASASRGTDTDGNRAGVICGPVPGPTMKLEGSCHCGGVRFALCTAHPYPFNYCYCSICRKTAGSGGYAINLAADNSTLQVQGKEKITVYRARILDQESGAMSESPARRHFCSICGSALWAWDPRWPDLIHPFASAIDTQLPVPSEHTHLMAGSKASWVELRSAGNDKVFDNYPDESIAQWHRRLGLEDVR